MSSKDRITSSYNKYADEWAERIDSGLNIAQKYLEKPAMYAKVPDLKGKRVLCVGSGTGEEAAYLHSLGSTNVTGIDISEGMVNVARRRFPQVEFRVADMEEMSFLPESFDFIYSSLTLAYVESWTSTLANIYDILVTNGTFLFSTNHPVKWGAELERTESSSTFTMGYTKHRDSEKFEVKGDYLNPRQIQDIWFNEFPIEYFHKPFGQMLGEIRESGFQIIDCVEPKPVGEAREIAPTFWEIHQRIPLFIIFKLLKV